VDRSELAAGKGDRLPEGRVGLGAERDPRGERSEVAVGSGELDDRLRGSERTVECGGVGFRAPVPLAEGSRKTLRSGVDLLSLSLGAEDRFDRRRGILRPAAVLAVGSDRLRIGAVLAAQLRESLLGAAGETTQQGVELEVEDGRRVGRQEVLAGQAVLVEHLARARELVLGLLEPGWH